MADIEVPKDAKDSNERKVGVAIAVLAIVLAVVATLGTNQDNEKLAQEVSAANGYAWYQSKRIRVALNESTLDELAIDELASPTPEQRAAMTALRGRLEAKNAEYKQENEQILKQADAAKAAAQDADERGNRYDQAEVMLQVSIVLCSITLLTGGRGFLAVGLLTAGGGIVAAVLAWFS